MWSWNARLQYLLSDTLNPITHFLIGWAVANSAPSLNKRERAFVTCASVAPDLDGLGIVGDWLTRGSAHPLNWWGDYHHTFGHNLSFGIVFSAITAIFARQKMKTTLLAFISFHLHLFGDIIGARGPDGNHWPVPYLFPFSNQMLLEWSGQWALNSWPNFLITGFLIAVSLVWARRRGFSPLEMFSARADTGLVGALRARFPTRNGKGVGPEWRLD